MAPGTKDTALRVLDKAKPAYWLPMEPVAEEVLIPALSNCSVADFMSGYFSGVALAEMAPGLASYIVKSDQPLRLLVGPTLTQADQDALLRSEDIESSALKALESAMTDEVALTSLLARHTLECLAFLLSQGRLQMRVVILKTGIYHPKHWAFRNGDDAAVLSGSANMTGNGLLANIEQLRLDRNWRGQDAADACEAGLAKFEEFWSNQHPDLAVSVEITEAAALDLLRTYSSARAPTEKDYERALASEDGRKFAAGFHVPAGIRWRTGPFQHQGEAVRAWERSDRRGVLSIATGGGKTICALVAAQRLAQERGRLFIAVAAPSRPLVAQWADEMREFGLDPYVPHSRRNAFQNAGAVEQRLEAVRRGLTPVDSVVMTNNLLNTAEINIALSRYPDDVLLIGDEVHNLGSEGFITSPPAVRYRLGLSATPVRQYDPDGTKALFDYFGGVVSEFGLDRAIGVCLVPYDYHIHEAALSDSEMDEYRLLSEQIRLLFARLGPEEASDNQVLKTKLLKRRLVLESASQKIDVLEDLLAGADRRGIHHTLIYATDKGKEQLDAVNALLRRLGVSFHQLTEQETSHPELVAEVVARFRRGRLQVLTAKRVLDEGVNIPEIETAYVLASTTVERQWVQRRGRILRLCPEIGKAYAVLHDIVALPPAVDEVDEDVRKLVKGEMRRVYEFARLARNQYAADGPMEWYQKASLEFGVWGDLEWDDD